MNEFCSIMTDSIIIITIIIKIHYAGHFAFVSLCYNSTSGIFSYWPIYSSGKTG